MLLNQQYDQILQMDIVEAMSFIQAAASLRKEPKQKKPFH